MERITKYIEKFNNHPITLNKDAVDAFNKNKFFSNLQDFTVRKPSFFDDDSDFIDNI